MGLGLVALALSTPGGRLRKLIVASLVVAVALAALIVIDKTMVSRSGFGSVAVITLGLLALWSAFCLGSLAAYRKGAAQLVARVWLSIMVSVGTFVVLDLALGAVLIVRLSPRLVRDAVVHHRLEPNTQSDFKSSEYHYIQKVNNLGLRGPDVEPKKAPGTYRILTLGDSFTMGKGVADDKTFSALLERSLNGRGAGGGRAIQVLNAGVDSYSPLLSYLQLTRLAPVLEPDLVVQAFDMSDLIQEIAYRAAATVGPDGEILGVNGLESGDTDAAGGGHRSGEKELLSGHAISTWINHHMFGTRLVLYFVKEAARNTDEYTIDDTVETANRDLLKHTLASDAVDRTEQWANVFDSLLKTKRYCEGRGIGYLLVIYPWGHQVNEREWGPGRTFLVPAGEVASDRSRDLLTAFATEHSITLVDLFPLFRGYTGTERLYFDYDMHWTEAGHALVRDELERFILSGPLHLGR